MDTDRWERIESIFHAALDRDPAERAAFLDQVCADAPTVRQEVEAMLAAHAPNQTLAVERRLLHAMRDADGDRSLDTHIGPYRLVDRIGRGGMGEIFRAERDDDQFQRQVALKLIKRGMDTDAILRRFRQERQILAALAHPGIARLYDGGVSADGRPYFALEYVEDGTPIDAFCDRERLPIDARLRLFRQVCDAVHYAHQNLVVHRDLKPSNILVAADGTPKLLDFGIAKLLDPSLSPYSVAHTQADVRVMTPEYAAPEQVRGGSITTATDVYGLGVLLYELLTGHRPYRLKDRATEDISRVICEEDPTRPSTAVERTGEVVTAEGTTTVTPEDVSQARSTEPSALRRRLRGDLDTIVLKAMQKEPQRRYASVEALADDVQRFLEGRPVQAQPDSIRYRTSKFVRRHRVGVAAAAAFAVLMLAFGIAMAVQSARVARERDVAQHERAKAEQVTDFVLGLFESADPVTSPRDTIRVRDVLETGAERVEALEGQPTVQAEMYSVLGTAYRHLGRPARATSLEERALALRREHLGDAHPKTALSLYNLGLLREEQHQLEQAAALYREAATLREQQYGGGHPLHLNALYRLALTLHMRGKSDEADSLFSAWYHDQPHDSTDDDAELATTLAEMGAFLQYKGRLDEAESVLREAVAMSRRLHGSTSHHVGRAQNTLANVLLARQRPAEAESVARRTLSLHDALYPEGHYERAESRALLGEALLQQNRFADAETFLQDALAQFRSLYGENHPVMGRGYVLLAQLYHQWGRYDKAESLYRKTVALYADLYGEAYPITIERRQLLAGLLRDKGEPEKAESILLEAYRSLRDQRGANDRYTQDALERLVALYEAWEKAPEATRYRARLHDATE